MPHSVFSCTYGLVNIHGIKKATYNAYKLLRKLRGSRLDINNDFPLGCGMEACEEQGVTRIICYNQQFLEIENQPDWCDSVTIPVEESGEYLITSAKLEKHHGSCYETWLEMGAPQNLTPFQEERLRAASVMNYNHEIKAAEGGKFTVNFCLKADEVLYIELQKTDIKAMPRKNMSQLGDWNKALMIK